MAICSELISQDRVNGMIRVVKAALVGLEKLSDAEAAAFINAHPQVLVCASWMPATYNAAMIHEARNAKI